MRLYRSAIAAGNSPKPATKLSICSLGPPPLKKSEPTRCVRSVAWCLITAMLIVAPRGIR